ncbi:MAG: DUF3006 domain-containing protein [Clostridia bacterium]
MQVTIDRFEGTYAIVELTDKTVEKMPRVLVPGAKEGDIVDIIIKNSETEKRTKRIEQLMDEVW